LSFKKLKAAISSLLIVFSSCILVTGIGLWLAPPGRIAKSIGWTYLGFDKESLGNIHFYIAVLLSLLVVIHLSLNFKMLISEIKALIKN